MLSVIFIFIVDCDIGATFLLLVISLNFYFCIIVNGFKFVQFSYSAIQLLPSLYLIQFYPFSCWSRFKCYHFNCNTFINPMRWNTFHQYYTISPTAKLCFKRIFTIFQTTCFYVENMLKNKIFQMWFISKTYSKRVMNVGSEMIIFLNTSLGEIMIFINSVKLS